MNYKAIKKIITDNTVYCIYYFESINKYSIDIDYMLTGITQTNLYANYKAALNTIYKSYYAGKEIYNN